MKVIAYVRVSTDEQATKGQSLDAQQAKLAAYADLYDLQIISTIVDAGESAKSLKRPGLQQALTALDRGTADGILIAKLDRLTRSVADWNMLIDRYFSERKAKGLFSVSDSIDTRTAAGRLVLNVLMSVGQWERETIAERTSDAMQHKISKREYIGGNVPFGFQLSADGVTLNENHQEQKVIGLIRQLRDAGESYRKIANELTRRGLTTKQGNQSWKHTTVKAILTRAA